MASFNDLVSENDHLLVDFSADWCQPCKMMAPILSEVKNELGESVRIIKIDVDRNQELAQKYQIQGVPTLVLFRNGEQVWRQSGVVPAPELTKVIKRNLNVES